MPLGFGFVASVAAAITATDLVLEPSAGTGLLAIHAELARGSLVLNGSPIRAHTYSTVCTRAWSSGGMTPRTSTTC